MMMLFQPKKSNTQIVAEEEILRSIEDESRQIRETDLEEGQVHCRNIQALAEAYAALQGW